MLEPEGLLQSFRSVGLVEFREHLDHDTKIPFRVDFTFVRVARFPSLTSPSRVQPQSPQDFCEISPLFTLMTQLGRTRNKFM